MSQGGRRRAVREYEFPSRLREQVDWRNFLESGAAFAAASDQKHAAGSCPNLCKLRVVQKNLRCIGKERAVPQAVDAAIQNKHLLARVKIDRRCVGVFPVGNNQVAPLDVVKNRRGQGL
jgi:hypothetical protein